VTRPDATLHGTVMSTSASQVTIDSATVVLPALLIAVSIKVSLSDRNGKVLYENPAYVFREQYEVSQDLGSSLKRTRPLSVGSRRILRALWFLTSWKVFSGLQRNVQAVPGKRRGSDLKVLSRRDV